MKTITMTLTMQEDAVAIGKDKEEIKAGDMKKMMITVLIPEEVLVAAQAAAVVAGWGTKVQIGEQEAMKVAIADIQDPVGPHPVQAMETGAAVHPEEWEVKAQTGEREATRAATAVDIQTNKITWEEAVVSLVVLKTKEEEAEVTPAPAGEVLLAHLQTGVAVGAATGDVALIKNK